MQPQQKSISRIDLVEMKGQIFKRIGADRSERYFYYLGRLLNRKMSKNEFDKLCMRLIGNRNISLHNHFIRSILKNVCAGKSHSYAAVKSAVDDGCKQRDNGVGFAAQSLHWSNGVVSPKKSRSCIMYRKVKDRTGLFLSNGAVVNASDSTGAARDGNGGIVTENGEMYSCDFQRPVQKQQGFSEPPMSEREVLVQKPIERLGLQQPIDIKDVLRQDGLSKFSIHAPLGIPFCGSIIGGSRQPIPAAGICNSSSSYVDLSLPDTPSLQRRMEQIALYHGLDGVSIESLNILNCGLDMYLKRLITSCVSMVGGLSGNDCTKIGSWKQHIQRKVLNGLTSSNHHYVQNNGCPAEALQENTSFSSISMLDFKVAMELNPLQLGEDWPLVLEKISEAAELLYAKLLTTSE